MAEGNGLFHLVQEQFTPQIIRSLLFRSPLTGGAILGNGSVIEIEADCWSKAQSDSRYPLVATFINSLGSTVTSIDGRVSTLETDVGAIDGRVTALENSGGVAPTADPTVNSLTATTFVETPQLQSAAGDLQIQNALVTVRKEDGALLATLRRRRHQPGQGRDGGGGQHPERHHGGHHAAHRWQHGGNRRLQLQQQPHSQPGGRQQPPARSAAGALRPDRPLALDRREVRRASWSTTPSASTGPSPRRPACPTCSSPAAPPGWR